jgi:hypothetical protein
VAPFVTALELAPGQVALTHVSLITVRVNTSEPVFGLSPALFVVSGCGAGPVTVAAESSRSWLLTLNCTFSGVVTVASNNSASVLLSVTDVAGNVLLPSALSVTAEFDGTRVRVLELRPAALQVDPARLSPVVFNCTFSEKTIGVSAANFATAGSTASVGAVTVTALSPHSFLVSVVASGVGTVRVQVVAGGVTDLAANSLAGPLPFSSVAFGES